MLTAARKFARVPIVVTCFGIAVLGALAAGSVTLATCLILPVIILLVIHGNSINDLADYEIDRINLKGASDRPLVSGDISVRKLWWLHAVCGLLAVLCSFLYGPVAVALTIAVAIYNYIYSFQPLRITDRTLLSPLTLAATYSFLPFTLGYFSASQPPGFPWLLAVALYSGFIARLLLKDFRDVKGDSKFGKKTFLLRYGSRTTCAVSAYFGLASLVLISIETSFSPGLLAVLVVGNIAALLLLTHLTKVTELEEQMRLISMIAKIGNCSILALLIYYVCTAYLSALPVWAVLLPALVGFLLLYVIWRNHNRGAQVQLA